MEEPGGRGGGGAPDTQKWKRQKMGREKRGGRKQRGGKGKEDQKGREKEKKEAKEKRRGKEAKMEEMYENWGMHIVCACIPPGLQKYYGKNSEKENEIRKNEGKYFKK